MPKIELKYLTEAAEALEAAGRALNVNPKDPSPEAHGAAMREAGGFITKAASALKSASDEIEGAFEEEASPQAAEQPGTTSERARIPTIRTGS
jgi:hypothetical protein